MLARKIIVSGIVVIIALGTEAAHAELSCSAYIRGSVLQDSDVLAQAATIAAPLTAIGWLSPAMKNEAVQTVPYNGMWPDLLLHQIARDCQVLPGESVDSIVATHLKMAQRQQTAQQADQQEKAEMVAHYKVYTDLLDANSEVTCQDYLVGRPNTNSAVKIVWAWSVVEDDGKSNKHHRESFHGVGAPEVPRLEMTMEQAKAGLDQWCATHPRSGMMNGLPSAIEGVYAHERLMRFGVEIEDSLAKAAEKQKWAAADAARNAKISKAEAAADRAGPRMSCKWRMEYMRQTGGRPAGDSHASSASRQAWDWCSVHPNASATEMSAIAEREHW